MGMIAVLSRGTLPAWLAPSQDTRSGNGPFCRYTGAHALFQRAPDQCNGLVDVKRRADIRMFRPGIPTRRFPGRNRRHDDDWQIGMSLCSSCSSFSPELPGMRISDNDLGRIMILQCCHGFIGRGETCEENIRTRQGFFQYPAYGAVIVNDPGGFHGQRYDMAWFPGWVV